MKIRFDTFDKKYEISLEIKDERAIVLDSMINNPYHTMSWQPKLNNNKIDWQPCETQWFSGEAKIGIDKAIERLFKLQAFI